MARGGVRRRGRRPLPELRAHRAAAVRRGRHLLGARAAVRARRDAARFSTRRRRSRSPSSSRPASRRPTPPSRAAKAAFPAWRAVSPADRARLLRRLADARRGAPARSWRGSSRANVGKPISGARGEVGMVAQVFHFYAGAVDKHHGETIPVAGGIDVDLPRAARRRRPDRALELPAQHRVLEARPGARLRQHGRAEAGRADAAVGAPARRARARGRHPRGRRQRRSSGRARSSGSRLVEHPGRREDRVHRLDRGRPRRDDRRRRDDQARHARARRQVGERRLRRRRPRARRRGRAVRGLRQRRPGLLRPLARYSSSDRPTTASSSCSSTATREGEGRRPVARGDRDGPADQRRAPRDGRVVPRRRAAASGARPRTGPASGSRARSSRRRTTTGSRARRCSARSRR